MTGAAGRAAPAFQEYAADMLAAMPFRVASLAARGLLYTLRLECWVNGSVPTDPVRLAKVLGLTVDEVENALPEVQGFFARTDDGRLVCPELDAYRQEQAERRARMAEGGRLTGSKNAGRAKRGVAVGGDAQHEARHEARHQATHDAPEMPLRGDERRRDEARKDEEKRSLAVRADVDPWIEEYESEEARQGHQH